MIISSNNLNEIRSQIQKIKKASSNEEIIVKAQDQDFNQKLLEIKGINILLSPELHNRGDKLKQRDSGLNEFICKLAAKNKIKIAIDINSIQKLDKKSKAKVLARIMQNIRLCKRTKTEIILWPENKYNKLDALSFITTLKGSTNQAKKATE